MVLENFSHTDGQPMLSEEEIGEPPVNHQTLSISNPQVDGVFI